MNKRVYKFFSWGIGILAVAYIGHQLYSKNSFRVSFIPKDALNIDNTEKYKISLDKFLKNSNKLLGASGIAVISNDVQIEYQTSFGRLGVKNDDTADLLTQFRIGSISKPFTALAIILLQRKGILNIDDSICKFESQFCTKTKKQITIRHLLYHTSGLPRDFSNFFYKLLFWQFIQFKEHPEPLDFWIKNAVNAKL